MAQVNAAGAHTQHPGIRAWTGPSNLARVDIGFFGQNEPTRELARWAHYFDAVSVGDSYRAFATQRYLAAIEAVGGLG